MFDIEIHVSDPEKVGKLLKSTKSDGRLFFPSNTIMRFWFSVITWQLLIAEQKAF